MLEYLGEGIATLQLIAMAYLAFIFMRYETSIAEAGDDIGHHSNRIHESINHTNSLLDEMIDEAVAGSQDQPMPQGGLIPTLLHAFMSKNPMGLEHGTSTDRAIQENDPSQETETIIEHP